MGIYNLSAFINDSHPLFYLGIILIGAHAGGQAARLLGMPRITGYIVIGMLFSPSVTGFLTEEIIATRLPIITDMALAVIAFSIGGALQIERIRKLGGIILWTTIVQAFAVFSVVALLVGFLLPLINDEIPGQGVVWAVAVFLGAISAATAPAAVLGIIHEYRAKGPVTTVLLGVVTLDDAITIILFSVAGGIAGGLTGKGGPLFTSAVFSPLREIGLSIVLGAAAGGTIRFLVPIVRRKASLLGLGLGSVFLTAGTAHTLEGSSLLACMTLGITVANLAAHPEQWFEAVERIEEPILGMFFVLAGSHMRFEALAYAGWLAVIIIVGRSAAKIIGSYAGSVIAGAPIKVKKYLPLGLLPQAGVSVGLVLAARGILGDSAAAEVMVNAVLISVIINELTSPTLVRYALAKAGETDISGENDET
jgi:Kef-type K+ transport system membrane component KefB